MKKIDSLAARDDEKTTTRRVSFTQAAFSKNARTKEFERSEYRRSVSPGEGRRMGSPQDYRRYPTSFDCSANTISNSNEQRRPDPMVAERVVRNRHGNNRRRRLEEFFETKPPIVPTPFTFNYQLKLGTDLYPVDVCILLTVLAILIYLICRFATWKLKPNSTEILAQIVGEQDTIMLKLITLPYPSSLYRFTAIDFVKRISITGCIRPTVTILWPGFQIHNKVLAKITLLPLTYTVNPMKGIRLTRILTSRYEFLLFAKDCNSKQHKLVPLEGSSWQHVQIENRESGSTAMELWHQTHDPPQYV
jgi:hypothetical protein